MQIDVAIAVVLRGDRLLICRRRANDHLGGFWEFPGGKIEPNESPEDCVLRELREEVDVDASILSKLGILAHTYPERTVRLHPFLCAHVRGEASPLACDEVRWITPNEIARYAFPPANDSIIAEVLQKLAQFPKP